MTDKSAWFSYLCGAVLTLTLKWGQAVYHGGKAGKTLKQITVEWFFEPSAENAVSWAATIGAVWVIGSIYVDRAISISGFSSLPVLDSLAFLLGSLMEFTVPAAIKWLTSKLPTGAP